MRSATVVGSGPNGLAAALTLAQAGVQVTVIEARSNIGGGIRSHRPFTRTDALVDHCAGFHPMAVGSPALEGLEEYGLTWAWAEIDCAHPLIDDHAALLYRSVNETATHLGSDARRWKALFGYTSRHYPRLAPELLGPVVHIPRSPLLLGRFGPPTLVPAALLAKVFATPQARALFLGVAAHAMRPLTEPVSSAIGLGILTAGHHNGWPVARGGSGAIAQAMHDALSDLKATFVTDVTVRDRSDLPTADVTIFDTAPTAVESILGDSLPISTQRSYREFEYGPAAFKVDIAVRGGVPWSDPAVARAGTVHIGGSPQEIVAAEADVAAGRVPDNPFVLVGQQYVADPDRADGDVVPLYAYAHVPRDCSVDLTDAIISRIEQFAPGLRDRIVETVTTTPRQFGECNGNFVGGDILCGASSPKQLLLGPRPARDPYRTGAPKYYLCSAATPPGPGAHGMGGRNAALRALADLG